METAGAFEETQTHDWLFSQTCYTYCASACFEIVSYSLKDLEEYEGGQSC